MMQMLRPFIYRVSRSLPEYCFKKQPLTNHLRSCTPILAKCMSTGQGGTKDSDFVLVTFLKPDGDKITVKARHGKSLYDVVIDNNLDIDGFGSCGGTLCCTTCHLIFKESDYAKVGGPSGEEADMLDLAYGLTETSRLGCQVVLNQDLHPLEVHVPSGINDVRES